jgi:hypothetical protein
MIKILFISLLLFTLTVSTSGQVNIDSVILRYLRTVKGISNPEVSTTVKNGITIHAANYFVFPLENIKSLDKEFRTFLFGSTSSHERKYFLIQVISEKMVTNKIIDCSSFEDGKTEILLFLKKFNVSNKSENLIIRQLRFAYK